MVVDIFCVKDFFISNIVKKIAKSYYKRVIQYLSYLNKKFGGLFIFEEVLI